MGKRTSSLICRESIRNRCSVLQAALNNPLSVESKIVEACQSQASLAALSLPAQGIAPLSRNSLYKYADIELTKETIPNGFKNEGGSGYRYLDWLREEVKKLAKTTSPDRSRSARNARAQLKLQELNQQVEHLRKHSLGVSRAYFYLFNCLKGLHGDENIDATTRRKIANILNDHDRLYSDLFAEVGMVRPGNLEAIQN